MKPELTLTRLWWYHRKDNSRETCDQYVIDTMWDRHDIDYIESHAISIQWILARLEKAWQRVHKYDYCWAVKLSQQTGKPVCVWTDRHNYEVAV